MCTFTMQVSAERKLGASKENEPDGGNAGQKSSSKKRHQKASLLRPVRVDLSKNAHLYINLSVVMAFSNLNCCASFAGYLHL